MAKIVTFGELMLRLQPYNYERFVQCDHVEFTFGGGEANVAVSLANYGMDAAFVTKLPAHAIGQAAVNSLRRYGVDTTKIVRGGDRVGIYFNEKGASQRGSVCIYDRAYSAIQMAKPEDFDWDAIFEGAEWFHFTGITPALGDNLVEICKQACIAAKAHGCKISCDLNYRGKLWTREQARAAMTDLCRYVDVCISNEEDAKDVFGIEAEATDIYGGSLNHEGYKSVAKQLADKFGFEYYVAQEVYLDLREILTQEELQQLDKDGKVIYIMEEDTEERVPAAVIITDTQFVKDNMHMEGDTYFALSGSTQRKDMCRDAWDRILAWEKTEE